MQYGPSCLDFTIKSLHCSRRFVHPPLLNFFTCSCDHKYGGVRLVFSWEIIFRCSRLELRAVVLPDYSLDKSQICVAVINSICWKQEPRFSLVKSLLYALLVSWWVFLLSFVSCNCDRPAFLLGTNVSSVRSPRASVFLYLHAAGSVLGWDISPSKSLVSPFVVGELLFCDIVWFCHVLFMHHL